MNKNNYYNILKIIINQESDYELIFKNIHDKRIKINLNKSEYFISSKETQNIKFTEKNINFILSTEDDNYQSSFELQEIFNIPEINGFGPNSIIETSTSSLKISDIISGSYVLNNRGKETKVLNVYVFKINKDESNFPIIISKSNCGINLPFEDLLLSVRNSVKIKKINLKGRSLILNKKAKIYDLNDINSYYCLELENKNSYFVNGFVVSSI